MSNHTEECSGCLAEYNGECTAETCRGKITQLAHNSGKYTDSKERRCVYCGRTDKPIELAHYISRTQGGKGVPQNLISLCIDCHRSFDGAGRNDMRDFLADYLKSHYPGWNEQDQIFRKR